MTIILDLPFESLSKEARTLDEIDKFKSFELNNEVLYYKCRFCVSKFGEHRLSIMNDLHDIPIVGHPSFQKTYMVIKRHYYWPRMKKDVTKYVDRCLKCQVSKS